MAIRQPRKYISEEACSGLVWKVCVPLPRKVQCSVVAEEEDGTNVSFYGRAILAFEGKILRYHDWYTRVVSAKCTYSVN